MKKILVGFAFVGASVIAAQAQDVAAKDVPQAVSAALTQKYANATDLEWEKHGENYEADFDVDRIDHAAMIDPSGKILMTRRDIMKKDLPEAITTAIAQQYKDMRLDDMEQVEKDGKTYYQVELDQKGQDKKVVFSADGKEVTEPAYWD
ncbi:PepSY-like domain-containing protein [Pontibacter chinhatensis]|uniref:Putative beta-lactamase-inhibitor-like, PepSY-like n=1 Tax=Pontibacter chinhatensis TaxID=1436961 RepID=A0A1I2UPY6_9BACT|nr:PepSY-like domain-containing protein [Pontibacter chinhatensis]SFG76831.1 Putative beta-lactamase-inhibitor-like, PepSY-like [Pontibacter chinhatensis]